MGFVQTIIWQRRNLIDPFDTIRDYGFQYNFVAGPVVFIHLLVFLLPISNHFVWRKTSWAKKSIIII